MNAKNLVLFFCIISILFNCEKNPTSHDDKMTGDGFLEFGVYYNYSDESGNIKNIPFEINNVISSAKVFRKDIYVDTTIYKPEFDFFGITDFQAYNFVGTVMYLTDTKSTDIWGILPKKTDINNADSVYIGTINIFFVTDTIIERTGIPESIKLYKKNGDVNVRYFYIQTPEQYRISLNDASLTLTSSEQLKKLDLENGYSVSCNSYVYDEEILQKYDLIHINKYSKIKDEDNSLRQNINSQIILSSLQNVDLNNNRISIENAKDVKIENYSFFISK